MKDQQASRKSAPALLATVMLIASLILSGCSADPNSDELVARAKQSYAAGDYKSSTIDLKNALQENPQNSAARVLLGRIYVATGEGASAEKELQRAIELGVPEDDVLALLGTALLQQGKYQALLDEIHAPDSVEADRQAEIHLLRGKAFMALGEIFEAGYEFEEASKIDKDSPASWQGQALLAMAQQQWDEAGGWLDKILAAQPESSENWSLKGDLGRLVGADVEAEEAYSKAIKYGQNNWEDRLKHALVLIALENYEAAEQELATLEAIAPQNPGVNYVLGLLHIRQQEYPEAQVAFEQTLLYYPDHAMALFYLGSSHLAQNQLSQAENYLNRFVYLYPEIEDGARLLAAIRLSRNNPSGAESALKRILKNSPNDPYLHRLLGNVYMRQGKTRQGIEQLRQALSLQPDVLTQTQLGLTLLIEGQQKQGIDALETALAMEPGPQKQETTVIQGFLFVGEYDRALDAIEQTLVQAPDDPSMLGLKGVVYMLKNDNDTARQIFDKALTISPGEPMPGLLLARLESQQGNFDKASALYEQVLEHHPGHLIALMQFAALEGRRGNAVSARYLLGEAIESNPNALEPRLLMAAYYLYVGNPTKALEMTQPIQERYPESPALLALIGQAQLANQSPDNALRSFQSLTKVAPDSAQAHYLLAQAYVSTNNPKAAGKELEKAIKLNSGHGLAKIALARLSILQGRPGEAETLLQELKQAHPNHPEVLNLEGWMAMQQGNPEKAAIAYKESLSRSSNNLTMLQIADAQWQAKDREGSIATLETWLASHPGDLLALYSAGAKYLADGQSDKAKSVYRTIVKQDPTSAAGHNNLAWLLRDENPESAWDHAERAMELVPGNPAIMDTAGMLLLERGKAGRALGLLQQASKMAPSNPEIKFHLALAMKSNGENQQAQDILNALTKETLSPELAKEIQAELLKP